MILNSIKLTYIKYNSDFFIKNKSDLKIEKIQIEFNTIYLLGIGNTFVRQHHNYHMRFSTYIILFVGHNRVVSCWTDKNNIRR